MFAYRRVVLHQIHPLLFEDMFPVCSLSQNLAKQMFYHHFGVYRVLKTNPALVVIKYSIIFSLISMMVGFIPTFVLAEAPV
jgi:hypothetical protein